MSPCEAVPLGGHGTWQQPLVVRGSASATSAACASLDGVGKLGRSVLVGRRFAFVVTARRLGPLLVGHVDPERFDELVVDIAGRGAVCAHEHDDGLVLGRPDREHAVVAVEVAAADVVEVGAGQPIAGGLAAAVNDLADCAQSGLAPSASERTDLSVGDVGQRDFGRRLASRLRSCTISESRSPSGTVRPA